MDAGFCQPFHGHVVRTHPRPAAGLHDHGAGAERAQRRGGRGHCRGHGVDAQGGVGRVVRPHGLAQVAGGGGLWPVGADQAAVSAGFGRGRGDCGALHRPHRQGHPRCAARRAGGRRHAARAAQRRLRPAAKSRYRGRGARAAGGHRPAGGVCRQPAAGAVVRGDSGSHRGGDSGFGRA